MSFLYVALCVTMRGHTFYFYFKKLNVSQNLNVWDGENRVNRFQALS